MKVLALLFLLITQSALAQTLSELGIGKHTVMAEVANTAALRSHGLMGRDALPANAGMVFVFPDADRHSFWMANTPLPLSIAFIAENGTIINIEEMAPYSESLHSAKAPARYALEMNRGWFSSRKVRAGDRVTGLARLPKAKD